MGTTTMAERVDALPPRLECTDCGAVTHEQDVSGPVWNCPGRAGYALHRFEVDGE